MSKELNRREFLGVAGTAALAAGVSRTARSYAANETINVATIGTGGRCRHLMQALAKVPNARIVAVCDIYDKHIEEGLKLAAEGAGATKEYREILDNKDIDAVLIGSPDHWHVRMTIDACQAGKDVYVEKPLTHDLSEGDAVIKAKNDTGRIVQVGTQQRSMPHYQEAYEIVKAGTLGKIHKVHLTWNRNHPRFEMRDYGVDPATVDWKKFLGSAPDQPYNEYKYRNWRWFWDFGGGIFTDLMVHKIDIVHWFLGLDHPEVATSVGDHFQTEGLWQTPDTVQTLLRYPEQELQAYFEGTFFNARNAAMIEFMGTDATLYIDRGRYELYPETDREIAYREKILGTGPRGADFYDRPDGEALHLANWIECIKSREEPNSPVEAGVSGASASHLANKALRSGKVEHWEV
jgi:predicted dehydrogenase